MGCEASSHLRLPVLPAVFGGGHPHGPQEDPVEEFQIPIPHRPGDVGHLPGGVGQQAAGLLHPAVLQVFLEAAATGPFKPAAQMGQAAVPLLRQPAQRKLLGKSGVRQGPQGPHVVVQLLQRGGLQLLIELPHGRNEDFH